MPTISIGLHLAIGPSMNSDTLTFAEQTGPKVNIEPQCSINI